MYDSWQYVDELLEDLGEGFEEEWLQMWSVWFHGAHLKVKRARLATPIELYARRTTLMGSHLPTMRALV
jgi:hypothetical protein